MINYTILYPAKWGAIESPETKDDELARSFYIFHVHPMLDSLQVCH